MWREAWQELVLIVIVSGAKVGRGGKRFCRESDAGDNLGGDCGSDGGGGGGGQKTKLTIFMTTVIELMIVARLSFAKSA